MGKSKRMKVAKTGRNEALDLQISSGDFAKSKGRTKVIRSNISSYSTCSTGFHGVLAGSVHFCYFFTK